MTTRMTSKTVTFQRPFMLAGFSQPQAAGAYTVETEEEQMDAVSFPAWKRTVTLIHLNQGGTTQYQHIDPEDLEDALLRDSAPEDAAQPPPPRLVRRKRS